MQRTNIYLSEEQLEALRRVSEQRAQPVAALVREAIDEWLRSRNVRPIPEDEWRDRFEELLAQRTRLAQDRGWTEDEVERDVTAALDEVRRARTARRR
jgi:hypothetical protein